MARRENVHDKYILTLFLNRNEDGTYEEDFDFCTWRIPDPDTYGDFFICFAGQHEVGGNTERDHIQLFVKTKSRCRYKQITDRLGIRPDQVHYKPVFRTPDKAWDYCTDAKQDGRAYQSSEGGEGEEDGGTRHGCEGWTFGERPIDGRKQRNTDWLAIRDLAGGGRPLKQLLRDDAVAPLILGHANAFKWARAELTAPSNLASEWKARKVIIYHGPAGCGKSRRVREECERFGISLWVAPIGPAGVWYDGYDGHAAALWDDFVGGFPFRDLLNLLEGNEVRVQVKGSYVTFKPSVVFFTSDRHWREWCFPKGPDRGLAPLSEEEQAQLGRRVTLCEEMTPVVPLNAALGMVPLPAPPLPPTLPTSPLSLGDLGGGGDNTGTPPPPTSPPLLPLTELIFAPEDFYGITDSDIEAVLQHSA